jgi:hypothetical protein
MSETPETDAKQKLRDRILAERKAGNVVFWGLPDELMCAKLDDIVRQDAEGLLYDLNRLEEISMTFIDDPKWVNDFAVALVIRKIMEQRNSAERQRDEAVRIMREFVEHYEGPREQCLKGVSLTHFQNARQFLATLDRTEKP